MAVEVSHHIWVVLERLVKETMVVIALFTTPQVLQQVAVAVERAPQVVTELAVLEVLAVLEPHQVSLVHP